MQLRAVASLVGDLGVRQLGLNRVDSVGNIVNNEFDTSFTRSEMMRGGSIQGIQMVVEVVEDITRNSGFGSGISHESEESRAEISNVVRREAFRYGDQGASGIGKVLHQRDIGT